MTLNWERHFHDNETLDEYLWRFLFCKGNEFVQANVVLTVHVLELAPIKPTINGDEIFEAGL